MDHIDMHAPLETAPADGGSGICLSRIAAGGQIPLAATIAHASASASTGMTMRASPSTAGLKSATSRR